MGRKVRITKEQILEAGLQIILREGYEALSVKSVAAELGTSTTPITWTFDTIENYRQELRSYVQEYVNRKMAGDSKDTARDHRRTGNICVDLAIEEPNLLRYLRADLGDLYASGYLGGVFDAEKNAAARKNRAAAMHVSEEQAQNFMQFVTTYTEGIVSLILAGVIHPTKEEAHKLVGEAATAYFVLLKAANGKQQRQPEPEASGM